MQLVFTLASLVFLGSLALFAVSRNVRRAVWWGGSLGVVFGLWLLAPMTLRSHALYPQNVFQWSVVLGLLATLFLAIGLLLSLLTSWPLAFLEWRRNRNSRNTQAAALAWTLAVLPLAYLALGAALEVSVFPQPTLAERGLMVVVVAVSACGLWAAAAWLLYRSLSDRPMVPTRWVAACVAAASIAGLVRLVVTAPAGGPQHSDELPAFVRQATGRRPLLVIGLDGGNWRTLSPLIEQGRLPTLAGLARSGVHGTIQALWPPYWSTPAWGSIITGYHQDDLGVYENLGATAPMMPSFELPLTLSVTMNPLLLFDYSMLSAGVIDAAPADRRRLRRPPIWERLSATTLRTAVVYFPFTYPAIGQADHVVSNRAIADIWDMMGIRPGERDLLMSSKTSTIDLMRSLEAPLDNRDVLTKLLPKIEHMEPNTEALVDPVEVLRRALDVGERMFNLTEHILKTHRDLDLVFLYVGDFDSISHAFWRYRFPDDYQDRPSQADIDRLGPVLDRYLAHIDERIGRLIAWFPTRPNVLVVSDHGMEASDAVQPWRAWHAPAGMFAAGGPDIGSEKERIDVSYLDVAPTILDLLGYEKPADLRGRSVLSRSH